ncbi:glycosyltransferase family 4 protein [Cellulomonas hominis]
MTPVEAPDILRALAQRLSAVAAALLDEAPVLGTPEHDASILLDALVRSECGHADAGATWLLLTALTGALPTSDEVQTAVRLLDREDPVVATMLLLDDTRIVALERGNLAAELDLLTGGVLIDVNHTAHSDRHTGIQRVVRQTVPRWVADHDVELVAWTENASCLRALTDQERDSVLAWDDAAPTPASGPTSATRLVVPWDCVVVLPEVPAVETSPALAALARHSGNRVVAIGYDAIPVISADLRPWNEPDLFVRYLTVIKHARRVAGISVTAAAEFRGFSESLRSQGLAGPVVTEVMLAHDAVGVSRPEPRPQARPSVLCVGSQEVHKNHLAVMHAAERLWRDGLDFSLTFVGRPGWDMSEFDAAVTALRTAGRPLRVVRGMTDAELAHAYADARFAIFPSLHEGYGLPVAEALAVGTPVITSRFGSMREIADGGGCLLVDPHDDDDILQAMRSLLVDPAVADRLRAEAHARPARTWDTYATELWAEIVETELTR